MGASDDITINLKQADLRSPPRAMANFRPSLYDTLARGRTRFARVLTDAPRVTVEPGAILVEQGSTKDAIYWMRSGWAYRYRLLPNGRNHVLSIYLADDLFGVESVFLPRVPDTTVSLTRCALYAIDRSTYSAALEDVDIAHWAAWNLIDARRRDEARSVSIARGNAEQRVAALLLDLYERLRKRDIVTGPSFLCPLRQRDIADCLGITPVHANRVLKMFERASILRMSYGRVSILGYEQLVRQANGWGARLLAGGEAEAVSAPPSFRTAERRLADGS